MSGEYHKRSTVAAWCEAIAVAPFVPSINVNDRPTIGAPVWFTVEWEPDNVEPAAYCGVVEETGLLGVIVAGAPNIGDAGLADISDQVIAALLANVDPSAMLTLERAQPTAEHSAGTADRWYRLRTPIEYRLITGGP